jgi:hypothetical protein
MSGSEPIEYFPPSVIFSFKKGRPGGGGALAFSKGLRRIEMDKDVRAYKREEPESYLSYLSIFFFLGELL